MKHLFIVNPHSFRDRQDLQAKILSDIETCFRDMDDEFEIHISRYSRDAIAVIYHFLELAGNETVRIYAVGGDGILFDCLNGMVKYKNAELTNIPYGNANDFIRAFGDDAIHKFRNIKEVIKGRSIDLDVIKCGSNYALYEISIGIIGQTVLNAKAVFPHLPQRIIQWNIGYAYTLCAIQAFLDSELMNQHYTISADGEDLSGQYANIQISNAAKNGGTLSPSPYAMPNNGHLEMIMAKSGNAIKRAVSLGKYSKGKFEKYDFYVRKKVSKIKIKSDIFLRVEIDCEGFIAQELEIEIIPNSVKFFAPNDCELIDFSYMAYKKKKKGGHVNAKEA